jgi:hypothetical protein
VAIASAWISRRGIFVVETSSPSWGSGVGFAGSVVFEVARRHVPQIAVSFVARLVSRVHLNRGGFVSGSTSGGFLVEFIGIFEIALRIVSRAVPTGAGRIIVVGRHGDWVFGCGWDVREERSWSWGLREEMNLKVAAHDNWYQQTVAEVESSWQSQVLEIIILGPNDSTQGLSSLLCLGLS